jgi:hypothetical protein
MEDFHITEEGKQKGDEAEFRFKEWLDNHNIPYYYIKQDPDSFSAAFKTHQIKRPDFMILLPHFGFIFVDVKNRKISAQYDTLPLDSEETKKFSLLQRICNIPLWYAISNEDYGFNTWFWVPVSKVFESGMSKHSSSKSQEEFYAVPVKEFIQIADSDSLDRLFSKSFESGTVSDNEV